MRISGPLVSSIRETRWTPSALRRLPTRRKNSSEVACEKLQRMTLRPALTHLLSVSKSSDAGPTVATTLVSGSVVSAMSGTAARAEATAVRGAAEPTTSASAVDRKARAAATL